MRHLITSFATTGLLQFLTLCTGVLAARLLMPEGRGELAAILLWPSLIAGIASLSNNQALAHLIASKPDEGSSYMSQGLLLSVGLSLLGVIAGWIALPVLTQELSAEAQKTAQLLLLFIPITVMGFCAEGFLHGTLDFAGWNLQRFLTPALYLAFVVIFWGLDTADVPGFAMAMLVGHFLATCIIYGWIFRNRRLGPIHLSPLKEILKFGLGIHLPSILQTLSAQIAVALLSLIAAPGQLGLYVVTQTLATPLLLISNTLVPLILPKMGTQDSRREKALLFGRYLKLTLLLSVIGVVIVSLLGPWLLPLLFGNAYQEGIRLLPLLLIASLLLGTKNTLTTLFKGLEQFRELLAIQIVTLSVSAGGILWLLPSYGLFGLGTTLIVAEAAAILLLLVSARLRLKLPLRLLFLPQARDREILTEMLKTLRH